MRINRNKSGSQILELMSVLLLLIPIVLFFIDVETLLRGKWLNDHLAREAARVAAKGPPGILKPGNDRTLMQGQPPYMHACLLIEKEKPDSAFLTVDNSRILVTETVEQPVPSPPYGGPVSGSVTVQITMQVRPQFIPLSLCAKTIDITSIGTFPYTWAMKPTLVPIPVGESR